MINITTTKKNIEKLNSTIQEKKDELNKLEKKRTH